MSERASQEAVPLQSWARPFFTIWTGQALSLLGSRIAAFALVWWLTETTGSAIVLTLSTLMYFLPQIVLGPFAGALIDRWSRRRVMVVADAITALASAGLAWFFWIDAMAVWHVYLVTFIGSLCNAFHSSAFTASTSLMVPERQLTRVQGANQMLQGAQSVVAPPAGALLLSVLPLHAIMGIDVVTAAFAIVPLFFIPIPQPAQQEQPQEKGPHGLWRDVQSGLRYLWGWPGMLLVTMFAMVINLVATPIGTLMPILVLEHFHGGALQLGWLELAIGVGMVAGGLLLSAWGGFRRRTLILPLGLFGFGAGGVLMGGSPPSWFSVVLVGGFLFGGMSSLMNGTIMAIMQAHVKPEMQGRIFSVLGSGSMAATPLGLLVAGPVAEFYGAPIWFVLAGLLCMVAGISIFFIPPIMNLDEDRDEPPAAVAVS